LVRDVVVIGIPSNDLGEEIAAFVVSSPEADRDSLIAHCRAHLAPYKVPKSVEIIDELPKTALGKVVKGDLAALLRRD
jgi:acyl-CoA synthetase (AMP-forming)/AMP-acid ligase II